MNYNYLAHIIRDTFSNTGFTIYYGLDKGFVNTLRSNEHSIGAFQMHSEHSAVDLDNDSYYWYAGVNGMFFDDSSCDLFISFNYNPYVNIHHMSNAMKSISNVMKPGGLVFLFDKGEMFNEIPDTFINRWDLVKELKRYKILADKEVFVYESI